MIIYSGERIVPHIEIDGVPIDPCMRVHCPRCRKVFMLKDGQTIQGVNNEDPATGFFCSTLCILKLVPLAIGSC